MPATLRKAGLPTGGALIITLLLSACGLAETAGTAAATGASAAEQARQAREIEAQVEQQVLDAQAEAKRLRDEAEAASQ
jgi:hypothetical protein